LLGNSITKNEVWQLSPAKISYCLRNKMNMICSSLKRKQIKRELTFSQIRVSVDMTLRLLGFTGKTRKPGIMYYCERNIQLNLAKHRAVFTVSARCFHMVLHDKFFYLSVSSDVCNLLFSGSLNVFVTLPMMT